MLKLDNKNKKVIIGQLAFQNADEKTLNTLQRYISIGYEVEIKEHRTIKGDKTTDKELRLALADDEKALNTYLDIKKDSFFKAKKWAKDYLSKH